MEQLLLELYVYGLYSVVWLVGAVVVSLVIGYPSFSLNLQFMAVPMMFLFAITGIAFVCSVLSWVGYAGVWVLLQTLPG